ncbi:MAG: preprotein translocase subunit SecD [Mycobacterium sp.]
MRVPRPVITVLAAVAALATLGTVAAGVVFSVRGPGSGEGAPSREAALPSTAPAVVIKPLAVRPVVDSRGTTPEQCPPPAAHVPPTETLEACDIERTAAYTLGPVVMQLQLTRVDSAPLPIKNSYVVRVEMDTPSSAAFAEYTAAHVGQQMAFVRNGVVVSAPGITAPIISPAVELSGELTAAQAEEVARRLREEA